MPARQLSTVWRAYLVASVHSGLRSLHWQGRRVGDPEGVVTDAAVHDAHDFILATGTGVDDLKSARLGMTLTILIKATAEILTTWK